MEFKEENELKPMQEGEIEETELDSQAQNEALSSEKPQAPNTESFPQEAREVQVKTLFEDRKYYIAITSLFVALAILLTFVITFVITTVKYDEKLEMLENSYNEAVGEFSSIIQLYNALPEEMRNIETYKKLAYIDYYYRTNYVGELNEEQLVYMIANGYIVGAEDLFGGYYSKDEFASIMNDVGGSGVGIGVYVKADSETGNICILHVMKDGPSAEAGLLAKDIVTHVDGKSVVEVGYDTALDLIKGEENTTVKLTVLRGGKSLDITVTRRNYEVETVVYNKHQTENGVGVIRIMDFNGATAAQFMAAIETAINKDKCTSLVFDLRDNPGGLLTAVVEMLDFMLPEGVIVSQRYADGEKIEYKSDAAGAEFEALYGTDIKMAVLVNGGTASAAELFTCALKDYGKAIVVGEQTFGKGCGQNVIPLGDGTGLAITTFMYDPPKSENYNGVGIEPTVPAKLSEEAAKKNLFELSHSDDDQLKAAIKALKK